MLEPPNEHYGYNMLISELEKNDHGIIKFESIPGCFYYKIITANEIIGIAQITFDCLSHQYKIKCFYRLSQSYETIKDCLDNLRSNINEIIYRANFNIFIEEITKTFEMPNSITFGDELINYKHKTCNKNPINIKHNRKSGFSGFESDSVNNDNYYNDDGVSFKLRLIEYKELEYIDILASSKQFKANSIFDMLITDPEYKFLK